jgi:predicted O-methyltransferase YrrM
MWRELATIGLQREQELHPHVLEERAQMYWAPDGGSIDTAMADLLYGLVRVVRPAWVIETGTGFSTLVLAAACLHNNWGKIVHGPDRPDTPQVRIRLPRQRLQAAE